MHVMMFSLFFIGDGCSRGGGSSGSSGGRSGGSSSGSNGGSGRCSGGGSGSGNVSGGTRGSGNVSGGKPSSARCLRRVTRVQALNLALWMAQVPSHSRSHRRTSLRSAGFAALYERLGAVRAHGACSCAARWLQARDRFRKQRPLAPRIQHQRRSSHQCQVPARAKNPASAPNTASHSIISKRSSPPPCSSQSGKMPSTQIALKNRCKLIADTIKAWAKINHSVGNFRLLLSQLQETGFKIGGCKTSEYKTAMIAIKAAYPHNKQKVYINYMCNFKKLLSQPLPATGDVSITRRENNCLKSTQDSKTFVIIPDIDEAAAAASSTKPAAAKDKLKDSKREREEVKK
jgi:hypothetical protein